MNKLFFNKNKWSRSEIISFLERAELYSSAGLPLDQTLLAIEESSSKNRRNSIRAVRSAIEKGIGFSIALSQELKFKNTLINIIKHGEQSGNLGNALESCRSLAEKEDELIKKCLSALAYPIVIAVCAGLLTVGLLRGIMPQIIPTLKSLNVKLPLLTHIVIFISEEIAQRGIWYLLLVLIVLYTIRKLYIRYIKLKTIVQYAILYIPFVGKLYMSYCLSISLRSMGTLLNNGVTLTTSHKSIFENLNFIPLNLIFKFHYPKIERGEYLHNLFKNKNIPEYISPLIAAGEKTGTLGVSMLRAATILDRDIEHALKRLTALIEPLMMVMMGCIIGAIALSIMLPIYDVSKVLQK